MTKTVLTFMVTSPTTPKGQFGDNVLEPWIAARGEQWENYPHPTKNTPPESWQYRDYMVPSGLALIELYDFLRAGPPRDDEQLRHDYTEGWKRFWLSLGVPRSRLPVAPWRPAS